MSVWLWIKLGYVGLAWIGFGNVEERLGKLSEVKIGDMLNDVSLDEVRSNEVRLGEVELG